MRSAVVVLSFVLMAAVGQAQVWSDTAQYNAYMKGDWEKVVELGKLAKKAGIDYYYIRARNGYANYMLGKYFKAEKEFEHAHKFNGGDSFSKKYGYWSSALAGNISTALVKSASMSVAERDSFKVVKPKWTSAVSALGGYRASTSQNVVGNMPYLAFYLDHQIGRRITLHHGVGYLNQTRTSFLDQANSTVWQVGYLASLGIQVAKHTTVSPSFIMQNWHVKGSTTSVFDLNASLAIRQQFGNVNVTLIGGYFQDRGTSIDTTKFMVGGSVTWYPLQNLKLYSITSGGFNFGGEAPNPFVRQTIGGNLFKGAWLASSFTWNNRVIAFDDIGVDFTNNSSDRLNWLWTVTPTYFPIPKLGISLTYSVESRLYYQPGTPNPLQIGPPTIGTISSNYNFHSFYLGLSYNF